MKPTTRSISGALLTLAIIPAMLGLLACLPVPIGDPERSRIDPQYGGVWMLPDSSEPSFYVFEPYDKRTWLLTRVPLEAGRDADFSDYDLGKYDDVVKLMESQAIGTDGATASAAILYKAWRTRLGGKWFMTWEPKGLFSEEDFRPEEWLVFRVERPDANTLELYMLRDKLFENVEETRRAYERVIRKNAKNPELYAEEPFRLHRVRSDHLDFFAKLARTVIDYDRP